MFETHIMMRKDEPPIVSLVLVNARVLLLLDFLDHIRKFVLSNTAFTPRAPCKFQAFY